MKTYKDTSKTPLAILNEPAASYGSSSFYELSSRSISKEYIKDIIRLAKLTVSELISFIPISIDSYKRRVDFNPSVTEKVLEIEEVYRRGLDAFGDSFYHWMDTKNVSLDGKKPKELLANSFGVRILLDEIGKLEHGVLA
jgi:putative toxin-antitoxin system antitoxin component (TIGR02293 family)